MSKKVWLKIFKDLDKANESAPRGQKIKEILNYTVKLHPIKDRFCSFDERKLNFKYLSGEFAWYLRGNRDDTSIIQYSKFWDKLKNPESPIFNSNYGHYIFTENQFNYVIDTLAADKDSRQAVVIINNKDVMMSNTFDKICTYSMSFHIRKNKLNMIINMRSNDVIRGFSIDVVMFSYIYEMLYLRLRKIYPGLKIGTYYHNADSFHIYELHYPMMKAILENQGENYFEHIVPKMKLRDVKYLTGKFLKHEEQIRTTPGINKEEFIQKNRLNSNSLKFSKYIVENLF